ncbi:hypothetical protein C8P66_103232 [Humitalea rosea]|uniref:DUF2171 domain-containing protein n=1 Tax=Humitalea rosea TaxID=990373 RepID=A0A2W7JAN5_9PROT|nr:DUF2171 domain-containing protein [Humitalea rosea]PZW49205.1 hypothetical protein C8P66_103232 [Humitalea rosea]
MLDRSRIKEHMEVVGSCGNHVGTVDHLDGDRIKLTRSDNPDDQHTFLPLSEIAIVEAGRVVTKHNHMDSISLLRSE